MHGRQTRADPPDRIESERLRSLDDWGDMPREIECLNRLIWMLDGDSGRLTDFEKVRELSGHHRREGLVANRIVERRVILAGLWLNAAFGGMF
ncbi:hypothetical protein [Nonomuraea sp. NPDC049141]|uniref:hypothetical protein n=1 Tax=Nonomuraea sp. NPDC049141 TaxID=3155500 RepID=UPI0033F1E006